MQEKNIAQKIIIGAVLIGAILVMGPAVSYVQTVMGFTDPPADPPGGSGAITALNGNVGIGNNSPTSTLSVNGEADFFGNLVHGVAIPVDGTDAVNKDYVLAQAGGGGGGSIVTYGVSAGIDGSAIRTCPWINWNTWACGDITNLPVAGSGAPACPAGYTEVYAGYGPYGIVLERLWLQIVSDNSGPQDNFGNSSGHEGSSHSTSPPGNLSGGDGVTGYEWTHSLAGLSYSNCSNSPTAEQVYTTQTNIVYPSNLLNAGADINVGKGVVSACAPGTAGQVCNTCRVCVPN